MPRPRSRSPSPRRSRSTHRAVMDPEECMEGEYFREGGRRRSYERTNKLTGEKKTIRATTVSSACVKNPQRSQWQAALHEMHLENPGIPANDLAKALSPLWKEGVYSGAFKIAVADISTSRSPSPRRALSPGNHKRHTKYADGKYGSAYYTGEYPMYTSGY
jgi:hypothetical protein